MNGVFGSAFGFGGAGSPQPDVGPYSAIGQQIISVVYQAGLGSAIVQEYAGALPPGFRFAPLEVTYAEVFTAMGLDRAREWLWWHRVRNLRDPNVRRLPS